jgi:D-alanyl-D-alanine carboxypeptidase (penicillin-binding protein 5/6)
MFPRRTLLFLLAIVPLFLSASVGRAAQAYVIADAKTGYILEASGQSKDKRQVGSLTKIATACVVLDWVEHSGGRIDEMVSIPPAAFVGIRENYIGFSPGDTITLRDLMYAALVQSDNIAAFTLAAHVGSSIKGAAPQNSTAKTGPIDTFVGQMNALARQLRMEKTRFVNPHGIDENVKPVPFASAEDMARLTRYAMDKASFRFYVSQHERQISFAHNGKTRTFILRNTNELVGTHGIDGVKTGQTARAGNCLILSAAREPDVVQTPQGTAVYQRRLIIVLLGSANRFGEGLGLVNRGWGLYEGWAAAGRVVDPQKVL